MRYLILILALISWSSALAGTVEVCSLGRAEVSVPASQYINVYASGPSTCNVYKNVGYPNVPSAYTLETNGSFSNKETSFGPYTYATTIRIEAGQDPVYYSVGSGAVAIPCVRHLPITVARSQLAPATMTITATFVSTDMMGGIITGDNSNGGPATYTLPTGTLLDAASSLNIGEGFSWSLINLSTAAADIITVAAGSGHTCVGVMAVPSAHASTGGLYGNAAKFFSRKTAANTFVTYRQ